MLKIENLSVSVRNKELLKSISLKIDKPGVYALVGANGAGKTTLIKTILGMYPIKEGVVEKEFTRLGYIPEVASFFGLTVIDYLKHSLELSSIEYNERDIEDVLYKHNLVEHKRKKASKLSSGMKQKVFSANIELLKPDFIICDEPTANMDIAAILNFYKFIDTQKDIPILITSHNLNDLIKVANEVIVLKEGEIVFKDNKNKLLEKTNNKNSVSITSDNNKFSEILNALSIPHTNEGASVTFEKPPKDKLKEMYIMCVDQDVEIFEMNSSTIVDSVLKKAGIAND